MKHIKLYEEYVVENIFLNYTKIVGNYDFNKFVEAYKELHKDNVVVYDKKNDETWGFRKGEKTGHWRYDHDSYKLQSDLQDKWTLGLINGKKLNSRNHPWSE